MGAAEGKTVRENSKISSPRIGSSLSTRIYQELVYGGSYMPSIDAAAITFVTCLILGFVPTWDLLLSLYLFTYGSYTLNRLVEWRSDKASNPVKSAISESRKRRAPFVVAICYIGTFVIAYSANLYFFAGLLLPLLLSYLYNVGGKMVKKLVGAPRLKEKFLVKNLVVSMVWGSVPLFTLLYFKAPLSVAAVSLCIFIFLRTLVNTIFSDMKDVQSDSMLGIKTIPTSIGLTRTRSFLMMLNTVSGVIVLSMVLLGLLSLTAIFIGLVTLYGFYYIRKSEASNANLNYLADFVAELEEPLEVPLIILGTLLL